MGPVIALILHSPANISSRQQLEAAKYILREQKKQNDEVLHLRRYRVLLHQSFSVNAESRLMIT
jgi:hypothetical protein